MAYPAPTLTYTAALGDPGLLRELAAAAIAAGNYRLARVAIRNAAALLRPYYRRRAPGRLARALYAVALREGRALYNGYDQP